jgi:outer membrane protein
MTRRCAILALSFVLAACRSMQPDVKTSDVPSKPWTPTVTQTITAPATAAATAAATAEVTGPITLARVLDIALENNPRTREAWLNARAAEAAVGSEQAAWLPEVDLNASVARVKAAGGSSQTAIGPSLALTYLLFDFGGRDARVEQARQTLIAADFLHNQSIQDVILLTQQAYYQYLDAKAQLAAQSATLAERKTSLDAAEARHNAGVATIADVLQARTALSQAQLTYDTIEGNLRAIEGALATAMGVAPTTQFELGELPNEVPANDVSEAIDVLIDAAQRTRPDLAASRAFAERAAARIREVRSSFLPSVVTSASTGFTIGNGGERTAPYSAAVGLSFPLFTGFRNRYDVRQAELEAELAREQLRDLSQQVSLDVWTSYYGLRTARQRLATSRDLLNSAQQSADVARARYREGVGTIVDVLTAQSALETARSEEVQARADWFLSLAQLAHDTGRLNR